MRIAFKNELSWLMVYRSIEVAEAHNRTAKVGTIQKSTPTRYLQSHTVSIIKPCKSVEHKILSIIDWLMNKKDVVLEALLPERDSFRSLLKVNVTVPDWDEPAVLLCSEELKEKRKAEVEFKVVIAFVKMKKAKKVQRRCDERHSRQFKLVSRVGSWKDTHEAAAKKKSCFHTVQRKVGTSCLPGFINSLHIFCQCQLCNRRSQFYATG